jgi:serine/threonine protein kinase
MWNKRIRIITYEIIDALYRIHKENSIHRDLHSENILYFQFYDKLYTILVILDFMALQVNIPSTTEVYMEIFHT